MELFDFVKLYRRAFSLLLVSGIVALAAYFSLSTGGAQRATADVLVRPPNATAGIFSSDPDRYVNNQLSTLRDEAFLQAVARELGTSPAALEASLSASHGTSTDIATIAIEMADGDQAVQTVNVVANAFVDQLRESDAAPLEARQARLSEQISVVQDQLNAANNVVSRAIARFREANGENPSSAGLVAPRAVTEQGVLTLRLQQLAQQQAQGVADASVNPSRVLDEARGFSPANPLGITAIGAAAAGLLLLVLAVAALALGLSPRIVGRARWARLPQTETLRAAEVLPRRGSRARRMGIEQVQSTLAVADGPGPISAAFLVLPGPQARSAAETLLESLRDGDFDVKLHAGVPSAIRQWRGSDRPLLLLVDAKTARRSDVATFVDSHLAHDARHVLPVLIT